LVSFDFSGLRQKLEFIKSFLSDLFYQIFPVPDQLIPGEVIASQTSAVRIVFVESQVFVFADTVKVTTVVITTPDALYNGTYDALKK